VKITTKLWLALLALVVLSPLGLILPAWLGGGSAWGEWSAAEMQRLIGYVPARMARLSALWRAPLPDYALQGQAGAGPRALSLSYIASAALGAGLVVGLTLLLVKVLVRGEKSDAS